MKAKPLVFTQQKDYFYAQTMDGRLHRAAPQMLAALLEARQVINYTTHPGTIGIVDAAIAAAECDVVAL